MNRTWAGVGGKGFVPDGENSRFEDNEDWEDGLEQFIDGLDDEIVLVSVDCHI